MRFKPRPRYHEGFFTGDAGETRLPGIGSMFIQPMVEAPSGQRVKLDVALENWFAVIGYGSVPLACADAAGRALVERLGARAVKIVESRAGDARRGSARPGLRVIEDADNELRGWFAARSSDVVVLRPDRYPAALTTSRDLSQALAGLGSHPALERVHPHDDQSLNGPRQDGCRVRTFSVSVSWIRADGGRRTVSHWPVRLGVPRFGGWLAGPKIIEISHPALFIHGCLPSDARSRPDVMKRASDMRGPRRVPVVYLRCTCRVPRMDLWPASPPSASGNCRPEAWTRFWHPTGRRLPSSAIPGHPCARSRTERSQSGSRRPA